MATPREPDEFRMSLMEHLGELRQRLFRVTLSILVLGVGGLYFSEEIYGFLMRPVLIALPAEASWLVYTSAIENLNVLMKIGLYAGIFLTTPVILWQIWQFVAPGLYEKERRFAAPFIFFGSLAFLSGATFCYALVLPNMFEFLLQKEEVRALTQRLDSARLREEDMLRALRMGDVTRGAALARAVTGDLEASGAGQTKEAALGLSLLPRESIELRARLEGLGKLLDALRDGLEVSARPQLLLALDKHVEAVAAWTRRDFKAADQLCNEAARLAGVAAAAPPDDFDAVWKVERLLSVGRATYDVQNWMRPMLSMSEQLTLVLVLELAFGVIFELPLVMMLLGMVGLVSSKFLFKYQRHALVLCLVVAAIITPTGDALNLSLMAVPMLACYELGVVLVWIVERRRAKEATA